MIACKQPIAPEMRHLTVSNEQSAQDLGVECRPLQAEKVSFSFQKRNEMLDFRLKRV